MLMIEKTDRHIKNNDNNKNYSRTPVIKKLLWASFVLVLMIAALGIGLGIGIKRGSTTNSARHSGSVVSNGDECAAIGGLAINIEYEYKSNNNEF